MIPIDDMGCVCAGRSHVHSFLKDRVDNYIGYEI